jgi:hypothetical protein
MPVDAYPVVEVLPEWVLEPEVLGSKRKFWYRTANEKPPWLFKYVQESTGQHWAEKIAAEVASCMGVLHAAVELAQFQQERGSVTESFARDGRNLFHGNQLLASRVVGYDPERKYRQSDHTVSNIFLALDSTFSNPEGQKRAKLCLADFLVLDALIGNTDRHHENWGILRRRVGRGWTGMVAPSFDHASSLGRELRDTGPGKTREALMRDDRLRGYAEGGRGGVYWSNEDARGPSPLELVRRATPAWPDLFGPALIKLDKVDRPVLEDVVERVPADWMSPMARTFAIELMCYNWKELRKVRTNGR